MTDNEIELSSLEQQLTQARLLRYERLETAAAMVKRANADFDRDAVLLGRKIAAVKARIAAESPPPPIETAAQPARKNGKAAPEPDPEWSQEEQDHYRTLVARGN